MRVPPKSQRSQRLNPIFNTEHSTITDHFKANLQNSRISQSRYQGSRNFEQSKTDNGLSKFQSDDCSKLADIRDMIDSEQKFYEKDNDNCVVDSIN